MGQQLTYARPGSSSALSRKADIISASNDVRLVPTSEVHDSFDHLVGGLSLPLFRVLAERLPNVTVHLVEAMTGYLDELIQGGRLDVALLYDHKAFEHVAWTEMITEDLMLFVPGNSPIAKRKSVSFKRLFDFPIVLPGRPNVLRMVIEQLAARHESTPVVKDCDSLPAMAKLVCDADFMTIMPYFAFVDEMARGEMVAVPIVDPIPSWTLAVVVLQRTMNTRASKAVARVMAELIAGMVEEGVWPARLRGEKINREPPA
jgi:DNA-binding transcriptional LysR family regulator